MSQAASYGHFPIHQPGMIELRAAELLGSAAEKQRATMPDGQSSRRSDRARSAGWQPVSPQKARRPLDHHLAHILCRIPDKRDRPGRA